MGKTHMIMKLALVLIFVAVGIGAEGARLDLGPPGTPCMVPCKGPDCYCVRGACDCPNIVNDYAKVKMSDQIGAEGARLDLGRPGTPCTVPCKGPDCHCFQGACICTNTVNDPKVKTNDQHHVVLN
ncbi:hypothetical protein LINPERHAP1_LOCUS27017 [Linum perenne]